MTDPIVYPPMIALIPRVKIVTDPDAPPSDHSYYTSDDDEIYTDDTGNRYY